MLKFGSVFLVLLCILEYGTGLYFHIAETERKCFIEEIPDETAVLGAYGNIYVNKDNANDFSSVERSTHTF